MSNLLSGKYWIHLVGHPNLYAGVDLKGSEPVPVITDGSENVWTITEVGEGNYTLVLGHPGPAIYIHDEGGNLVGDTKPPPTEWTIRRRVDGFTIEPVRGIIPTRGWTVNDPRPKEPVTINFIVNENPLPGQLWTFKVWPDPE